MPVEGRALTSGVLGRSKGPVIDDESGNTRKDPDASGRRYLGASPSKQSISRLKPKVRNILRPGNVGSWPEVRDRLNRVLMGWSHYYSYGTRASAYRAIDHDVYERVLHFLRRRHKVRSRGTTHFPDAVVFGKLGVVRLYRIPVDVPPWALW